MKRVAPLPGVCIALVLLLGAACGDSQAREQGAVGGRIPVVTTTTQLTNFVQVVGGNRVDVYGILKANVDAHDYEASPGDIARLASARVIVKNGVGLEAWFDPTIRNAESKALIVEAASAVAIRHGQGDRAGDNDPHIWHDPRNAKVMVHNIAVALIAVDPDHRADYEANEMAYAAELDRVDREIAGQIGGLTNKKLVTNHGAFGYYVDRYGLDFVGSIIPSFDSQAELSAQDISNVVRLIRDTGVKAVFSESSLPPKTAEAIGRDAGVTVVAGDDALYGDSLGPAGSDGDTYLKMLRHNTREIVDHLR
jgi:zinc/manganese transport system substrate-binding protein